jgi:hypothetical protein
MLACGFLVLGLLVLPAPFFAAARKKPASAAPSAAALKRVNAALDDPPDQPFDQPGALAPVFEQLLRMSANGDQPPLHVIQFGDSHTAADEWTGGLRDEFQQRFGNGGSGFSLAGRPFLGYRRFDIRGGGSTLWRSEGLRTGAGDGFFGLGGVSIETTRAGQSVYAQGECDSLEVDYLVQPDGGSVAVYVDDERRDEISTAGDQMAPGAVRYDLSPGLHSFRVVTLESRPVRLFGWVADRNAGVTYEALGINGAEAGVMLKWNEIMLATYLQRRNPAMIVLSYGTNEASDPSWTQEGYAAMFSSLLAHGFDPGARARRPVVPHPLQHPAGSRHRLGDRGTEARLPGQSLRLLGYARADGRQGVYAGLGICRLGTKRLRTLHRARLSASGGGAVRRSDGAIRNL